MEDLHINKKHSNIIKGIAILFVILGHMNYIDCAGPWGVHLFLILSGYGIYCSLEINGVKDFWKKRIQAVFLPYLFCTIFFLFIRFILNEKISFIMVIVSLLGLDFDMNVDSTMWYISYIFACYAMVWVIMKLKVKNKYAAICVGMLLWLCITIAGYKGFIWHKGTIAWAYVFSFPLGLFWARYRKKQISSKLKKMICGVMTTVCIAIVILDYGKPHSGIEELIFTFSAALAVLLFSQIISFYKVPIIKGGGIQNTGILSYFMYLNEGFLLQHKKLVENFIPSIGLNVLILMASYLIAYGMRKLWNNIFKIKGVLQ